MHRFYIKSPDIRKNVIEITDSRLVFQLSKVLRMHTGSKFSFFTEKQKEFSVEVLEIDRHKVLANIIEEIKRNTEPDIEVHLYQAIPKKPALFELVIQKATEIGVSHIYPLITDRTEKERQGRFERNLMIATEAVEQSRRLKIPELHHPVLFSEAIKKLDNAYVAFEYEDEKMLTDYLPQIKKSKIARIFIGPEGGFDQKEIDHAIANKANLFSFGPRILRTETASIAALSLILLSGK